MNPSSQPICLHPEEQWDEGGHRGSSYPELPLPEKLGEGMTSQARVWLQLAQILMQLEFLSVDVKTYLKNGINDVDTI